ncbi:hypothetical protein KFL_000850280 [Klebsormidium nitens]|uniref:Brain protein I3 n=1 Tax=Klebsormidium nitens TaxID=105231 RepID=A0A1Y1HUW2_KLENI|nr:hypothetical protein KFL_000850280 [Klebsormidium nitens]|eukprot:GAQ81612.1 hypothetical protein KFL_000850280 [Klebsormidium nitens]
MCESRASREPEGNAMEHCSTSGSYGSDMPNKRFAGVLKNLPVNYGPMPQGKRADLSLNCQEGALLEDECRSPVSPFSPSFKGPYGVPLEYGVPFSAKNPLVQDLLASSHECAHEFESKATAFGWVSSILLFPLGILCLFIFTTNRCIHCKVHKDSLFL